MENTEKPREKNGEQETIDPLEVISLIDDTLCNHIEKLLGTKDGIEALPLNLSTISSIILLAERETEIESFPYLPPSRYTDEKLISELAETSIEPGEELKIHIQDMIEKGYIETADDGRLFAKKPTISTAQLIDRIFPKMPGINLVAYIGQIISEVQLGQKEFEAAINQFNQMLEMYGVPLKKEDFSTDADQPTTADDAQEPPETSRQRDGQPWEPGPSDTHSQLKAKLRVIPASKPKSLTSQLDTRPPPAHKGEVEDVSEEKDQNIEIPQDIHKETEAQQSAASTEVKGEEPSEEKGEEEQQVETRASTETPSDQATEGFGQEKEEEGSVPAEGTRVINDDDVEKQIAAFEEELGMKCPLCRTGAIQAETTAKGKLYYHCSNKRCNMISWGKPYYLPCPQCNNQFLIESSAGTGKSILKCPRATCHYWQKFPWDMNEDPREEVEEPAKLIAVKRRPRRKVRRRRVVRRKR